MSKELQNIAMQIVNENTDLYMPTESELPKASIRDYFVALKGNINEFLKRDKELIDKLKAIDKALEEGRCGGKLKKALSQKKQEIEAVRDKMHVKLIAWWEEYDARCPISIKVGLTSVGETVCFGRYKSFKDVFNEQVGKIQWRVLEKSNGRAFLVSEKILDIVPYSSLSFESWQNSVLRKWCQDLYANSFTDIEKTSIIPISLRTPETADGILCEERVFIPSVTDIEKYMPTYRDRYVKATDVASDKVSMKWDLWKNDVPSNRRISGWWTRTSVLGTKEATCVLDRITTSNVENLYNVSANESREFYTKAIKSWPMGVRPAVLVKVVE